MAKGDKKRPRVVVDSDVVISHIIGDRPEHATGILSLWHESDSDKIELVGSTLLLAEVLGGGFADPVDSVNESKIFAVLDNPDVFTLVQVNRQVATIGRELRRELHVPAADAIHLATAVFVGAQRFVTMNSDDFKIGQSVKGVKIMLPGSLVGADVLPPFRL